MKKKGSKKRKALTYEDPEDEDSNQNKKAKKFCKVCGTYGYTMDEYTTLKAPIRQTKQKESKHFDNKETYNKHEVNLIVERKFKKEEIILRTYLQFKNECF